MARDYGKLLEALAPLHSPDGEPPVITEDPDYPRAFSVSLRRATWFAMRQCLDGHGLLADSSDQTPEPGQTLYWLKSLTGSSDPERETRIGIIDLSSPSPVVTLRAPGLE